LIEREITALS